MIKIFKKFKIALLAIYLHIFPLLLFLSLEILNVSLHSNGYSLILKNIPALFISYIMIYLTILFIYSICGRFFVSGLLVSIILLIFYIVNFYRKILTGWVFVPNDLNLAKQVKSIMAFTELTIEFRIILTIICVLVILVPLYLFSKNVRLNSKIRMLFFSSVGGIILALFFSQYSRENIMPIFNININTGEDVNQIYENDGSLMGFYTLCFVGNVNPPIGYSEGYMQKLVSQVIEYSDKYTHVGLTKPNVIVIMSEAFIDPSLLPNVTFSEDPVPNLHFISKQETSGKILSPSYGGLTCNPEYEFITGNAIKYVAYNDTPYYMADKYLYKDNPRTITNMYKKNGYITVGLHTNSMYFYDRDQHYPRFGFDKFIGAEMMPDAKYKGMLPGQELISDEYFTDKLIEQIEVNDQPLFLYGITMQNHFEYFPDKYESTQINAYSDLLDEEQIAYFETYLQGIYDADMQLGRLYEYVMQSDEPTIVVFFGDHLPIITQNTGVFSELGFVSENEHSYWTTDEVFNMYTTPYVAFANYKKLPDTWGTISPYILGAVISDAAYISKNVYYTFLMQAYDSFHAMTNNIYIDNDEKVYPTTRKADETVLKMFQAFQYDQIFGKSYVDEMLAELIE